MKARLLYRATLLLPLLLAFLLFPPEAAAQKTPSDFGFRHLTFRYQQDLVDILVKSKKGDEQKQKPLLFFVQGSLPQPLIKYDSLGMYGVFPFRPDSLLERYHLAIIGKPGIPVVTHASTLGPQFMYLEPNGDFPKQYQQKATLSYYVARNKQVLKFLKKQPWVAKNRLVVAGHSEGAAVAAKLASEAKDVTHLIYSGGNPMGRMASILEGLRSSDDDSAATVNEIYQWWQTVVQNPQQTTQPQGDTPKATYEFAQPHMPWLQGLRVPVLVTYGSKDPAAPFLDYLRVELMRQRKQNFTYVRYQGLEHNFFPLNENGQPDHSRFNWDEVAADWQRWLEKQ